MTAASLIKRAPQNGLQPIDLSRHLGGIARLVELCFGEELDAQGRGLIREMQFLSRAGPALPLLSALAFGGHQPWNLGFVWVESGRVVGTVSTQRATRQSTTWLIANVAVHPDERRRGIALALMRATLDLIRSHGGGEAILQVDDDNLGAVALYQGLGFARVATRTTWMRAAHAAPPPHQPSAYDIRLRAPKEWGAQLALASLVRPEGLAWNHPLRAQNFQPSLAKWLDLFFSGRTEEHWVAEAQRRLLGSLTVRTQGADGDEMTLLVHPSVQGQLERPMLTRGLRRLGRRPWPARLEHAADDTHAASALRDLGFQARRTLRWMRAAIR